MKDFKLIRAISAIVNNQPLDEMAQAINNQGISEMRKAGQNYSGQILLPLGDVESRDISALGNGSANIATDKLGIVTALRNNLTLSAAGAQFMSGLIGNVSIPTYSGSNVAWAGETSAASDGAGTFAEVDLAPKRLTAYLDISKQFLNQDSNSAEELLMNDLVAAISEKLEASILSNFSGSTTQPQGIFSVVAPVSAVTTYAKVVGLEEGLEGKNYGEKVWIVSPKAKSVYKTTQKGTNASMIMEGAEMDGYKVLTSNGLPTNGLVFGSFSDYVIGQWGAIDITVDQFTQAANGKIRLVVNAYFDAKPRRNSSFVTAFSA
nr:phage major capsid protein [uncultured Bacteroides sp.]